MSNENPQSRGQFGSKFGFILAAAGSAVGLGNIWKFPYITGENGGGLFVLIYLVCIALVGVPIMVAEIMIGRHTKKQPVGAFNDLSKGSLAWQGVGFLGVLAGFLMLSFYIVVAGWAVSYTVKSVTGVGNGIRAEAEKEAETFAGARSGDALLTFLAEDALNAEPSVGAPDSDAFKQAVFRKKEALRAQSPETLKSLELETFRTYVAKRRGERDFANHAVTKKDFKKTVDAAAYAEMKAADRLAATKTFAVVQALEQVTKLDEAKLREQAEQEKTNQLTQAGFHTEFGGLATDGVTSTIWAALFMLITIVIVAGGIAGGIERICNVLMPLLILMILGMVAYAATQPGFGDAVRFVFEPDASRLKASGVLEALGHAFFTLSLGMGAMITYGSYLRKDANVITQSVLISFLDTLIALLACLMMYPIIFSYGGGADAGPGLVFESMPMAFAQIGGLGMVLSALFFALLVFAALTSAISLLEVVASYFIDMQRWNRKKAAWVVGFAIFLVGLPSAFAADLGVVGLERNFFDLIDYLVSNWMLPLGGLFVAIFAGWVMPKRVIDAELEGITPGLLKAWFILLRFIAPILVILVLLQKVGALERLGIA